MTLDQGKPIKEALAEISNGVDHLQWMAQEARRTYGRIIPSRNPQVNFEVIKEPIGVSLALAPWNFPFTQGLKKVAASLAAGCPVILKGPTSSPSAALALAKIFDTVGLPKGVFNLLWGNPAEIVEPLIASETVKHISFTGSVAIGRQIAQLCGKYLKSSTLELGGHAPVIVADDVSVDEVATALARGKARNAGQVCVSPSRFYVHEKIYDKLVEKFVSVFAGLVVGPGLDPKTEMGPLINQRRLNAALDFIADAKASGAQVRIGGERLTRDGLDKGFFLAPTVLTSVPANAKILTQEPFCPIAPIVPFSTPAQALELANSLPYGLASYVYTGSLKLADTFTKGLNAGLVGLNQLALSQAETPFGGVGDSGWGREGGLEGIEPYLVTKFISKLS
jgi:succinate-semialdehyde dehydrogenase/glutarate-semialdehyde dehydrogenase